MIDFNNLRRCEYYRLQGFLNGYKLHDPVMKVATCNRETMEVTVLSKVQNGSEDNEDEQVVQTTLNFNLTTMDGLIDFLTWCVNDEVHEEEENVQLMNDSENYYENDDSREGDEDEQSKS